MKLDIKLAFKKLLGKGRMWNAVTQKTSDILDVFISPLSDVFKYFKNLKYTHFPTLYINENNIKNGEELFGLKVNESLSLKSRALTVESQWTALSSSQTWQQLENILRRQGLDVKVIENIPNEKIDMYGMRKIGNGFLLYGNEHKDPIVIKDGKHSFIVKFLNFFTSEQIQELIETLVKNKPAHNGVFVVPRYLRKKEIHHVLTKSQMQKYKKSQYCDVRTKGGF